VEKSNIYKSLLLIIVFFLYTVLIKSSPSILKVVLDLGIIILAIFLLKDELKESAYEFKKRKGKFILSIFLGFVAILVLQALTGVLFEMFFKITSPSGEAQAALFKSAPLYLCFSMLLFSPIVEELTFRGAFHKIIQNKVLYTLISSILYGALYVLFVSTESMSYLFIISYSLVAIVYPIIYLKTKSIYAPMLLHLIQNAFAILMMM